MTTGETKDIALESPEIVEKLKKELSDRIKESNGSNKDSEESEKDIEKRKDQINQMKALGYMN